jgi:hypothetical protein
MANKESQKIKVGDIVEVEFLDHVEDGDEPFLFIVWGKVAVNKRKHYEILCWAHAEKSVEAWPHNEKRFTIVKGAITRISKLTSL